MERNASYTCFYCGAAFTSYPGLRVVPQDPLPQRTTDVERVQTCGHPKCAEYEEKRLDRAVSEVFLGRAAGVA